MAVLEEHPGLAGAAHALAYRVGDNLFALPDSNGSPPQQEGVTWEGAKDLSLVWLGYCNNKHADRHPLIPAGTPPCCRDNWSKRELYQER